jgi:hypothetical protein
MNLFINDAMFLKNGGGAQSLDTLSIGSTVAEKEHFHLYH